MVAKVFSAYDGNLLNGTLRRPATGASSLLARAFPAEVEVDLLVFVLNVHFPLVCAVVDDMEGDAILELKAARGWSLAQAARTFLVEDDTIATWLKRIDEDGSPALVQLREPVNKFSDFVRYIVQRLKTLCPTLGKVKIAQILARASLHLGVTTVGRMLIPR